MVAAKCFYCDKKAEIDKDFLNPNTNEIHPICAECKALILTYRSEIMFFGKLFFMGVPLLVLLSIICFIFVSWQKGVLVIAAAIALGIISSWGGEYLRVKREKKLGTYVDRKKIKWCKTCMYFVKERKFDTALDAVWRAEKMPDESQIPCQRLEQTNNVWKDFFELEQGKRTLYPKNCPFWTKR